LSETRTTSPVHENISTLRDQPAALILFLSSDMQSEVFLAKEATAGNGYG
jgi:hypothetical protein